MGIEVEGLRINNLTIKDFIKDDLISDITALSKDIDIVALVLVKKNGEKSMPTPLVFNHQSAKEIQDKIMHIDCADTKLLESITKILEKRIKK